MLVGSIESVVQVHEKHVAVLMEAVLDVRVQELDAVEQINCRDPDGVE